MFAYCENDPVFRIDVNGTYSASKAIEYARTWWDSFNTNNYPNLEADGGGDCANFVSQCLFAGGYKMIYGISGCGWCCYPKYSYVYLGRKIKIGYNISTAWSGALSLFAYFRNKGYFSKIIYVHNSDEVKAAIKNNPQLKKGNAVIFFYMNDTKDFTHAALAGIVYKDPIWDIDFFAHTYKRDGEDGSYTLNYCMTNQGYKEIRICILAG